MGCAKVPGSDDPFLARCQLKSLFGRLIPYLCGKKQSTHNYTNVCPYE
jgi:hypothetical protein